MTSKTKTELNEICRIIVDTIQTNKIYLFGSYAYGSPNEESDYDICVIIPDSNVRVIDETKKLRRALAVAQSLPLDLLIYHNSRFEEKKTTSAFERQIANKGVFLYERV